VAELSLTGLRVVAGATTLLDGIALTVRTGEVVALVGPSGSGKTLTLRAMLDLLPFRPGRVTGEVRVDGQLRDWRSLRGDVGLLFQDGRGSLEPTRTLGAQIAHAARLAGAAPDTAALLPRLGFPDAAAAAARYPHELSGGMAQRAAVAVALARKSRFLLCDEPTTGLDAPVKVELLRELRQLREVGIVFVTHDLRLLPGFADRILVIEGGRVVDEAATLGELRGAGRRLVEATAAIAAPRWTGRGAEEGAAAGAVAAVEPVARVDGAAVEPVTRVEAPVLCELRALRVVHRRPWSFAPPVVAVDGVDLTVRGGEIVGLVGESGCGKTSLVRAACGLLPRESGSVRVLGIDPAAARRPPPGVQLVVQDANAALNPRLPIGEWVAESAQLHRPGEPAAAAEALAQAGLTARAAALPHQLSGGEKRRVTLATLGLAHPALVFADEPTSGLDAARKADFLDALARTAGPDRALVLVTHDLLLARRACTRLVFLHAGRIVDDVPVGRLGTVTSAPARRLLAAAGLLSAGP